MRFIIIRPIRWSQTLSAKVTGEGMLDCALGSLEGPFSGSSGSSVLLQLFDNLDMGHCVYDELI